MTTTNFDSLPYELQFHIISLWRAPFPGLRDMDEANQDHKQIFGVPFRLPLESRCEEIDWSIPSFVLPHASVSKSFRHVSLLYFFVHHKFAMLMGNMDGHSLYHLRTSMNHFRRLSGDKIRDLQLYVKGCEWDGTISSFVSWTLFFVKNAAYLSRNVHFDLEGLYDARDPGPYPRFSALAYRVPFFVQAKDLAFRVHEEGRCDDTAYVIRKLAFILEGYGQFDIITCKLPSNHDDYDVHPDWAPTDEGFIDALDRIWRRLATHYDLGHETTQHPCPHQLPSLLFVPPGSKAGVRHFKHWYNFHLPATSDRSKVTAHLPWVESHIPDDV